jgi:hypothetical protein
VLTGVSTNWEFTSELGTFTCSNATVAGTLTEKDGTFRVTGEEAGSSFTGCSVGEHPVTIAGFELTTVESTSSEANSGHVGLTFVLHWLALNAVFESADASDVFAYDAANRGSSIEVTPTALVGPCGDMTFHATFALTAGGKAVELW